MSVEIRIQRLPHAANLALPEPASGGSAGLDLRAALDAPRELAPTERLLVPTGLVVALPPGFEGQVRPRSGLALEHGITVLNAPGTIDSDYRGEVGVILIHLGQEPYTIEPGERIAQLVIAPLARVRWRECDGLAVRDGGPRRGDGGFGSTGR